MTAEANQDAANAWKDADRATDRLEGNKSTEALGMVAQAKASLAVAAELRALRESQDTANLIAWRNGLQVHGYLPDPAAAELAERINERLGL